MSNQDNEKIDLIRIAATATRGCHQVGTVEKSTVATVAEHSPTKKGKRAYQKKVDVTVVGVNGTCEFCGDDMIIIRTTGAKRKKYCGTRCRVAAHRARGQREND